MRVLWVSFLLIGTINCVPVGKGSGSNGAGVSHMAPTFMWDSGRDESSYPGSSSSLPKPSSSRAEGPGFNSGYPSTAAGSDSGAAYAAHAAPVFGGYAGSFSSYAGPNEGAGSSGFVSDPREENWSSGSATNSGVSEESSEPVFSDASDLEPVYSFSSRSSYQRGRLAFAQSRYTPGEPVFPPVAVRRAPSKTPSKQSSPAKAAPKGGF